MHRLPSALPALLVGVVAAAYWRRVLRMARHSRRKTGRAANFVPGERLGRALRLIWGPVVVVWVVHPFVTAALTLLAVAPPMALVPLGAARLAAAWLAWPAVAVAAACFAVTRACWKRMGSSWRMGIDPDERTALVATGPYAYVRHPIYALSAVMMLATVAVVPSPLMIAAGSAHLALLAWESAREERHMLRVHGPAYEQYRERVGRFVPASLKGYAPG